MNSGARGRALSKAGCALGLRLGDAEVGGRGVNRRCRCCDRRFCDRALASRDYQEATPRDELRPCLRWPASQRRPRSGAVVAVDFHLCSLGFPNRLRRHLFINRKKYVRFNQSADVAGSSWKLLVVVTGPPQSGSNLKAPHGRQLLQRCCPPRRGGRLGTSDDLPLAIPVLVIGRGPCCCAVCQCDDRPTNARENGSRFDSGRSENRIASPGG